MTKFYIGTSGWQYKSWNASFYPKGVKGTDQLPYLAKSFSTVEINSTFYRIPKTSAVEGWRDHTPDDFLFAVKLNNYLTHSKRLILDDKSQSRLDIFCKALSPLWPKTGSLLIQLPPRARANYERLAQFLDVVIKKLPANVEIACEFRHDSWFGPELYRLLKQRQVSLVMATYPGQFRDDYPQTSPTAYVRYHATAAHPDYTHKELDRWADYLRSCPAKKAFIYFNNDFEGWAIENAHYLMSKLET